MANSDIREHISAAERAKWNKNIVDLTNHIGAGGTNNHKLGNGTEAGFSINDYTNAEKTKLAGIETGALNNPHPATHPYTMITGLHKVANTGSFYDLNDYPTSMTANGGNSARVNGVRVTIASSAPSAPLVDKGEIWIDTSSSEECCIKVYAKLSGDSQPTWYRCRAGWG
jgi:hypothetical protein